MGRFKNRELGAIKADERGGVKAGAAGGVGRVSIRRPQWRLLIRRDESRRGKRVSAG